MFRFSLLFVLAFYFSACGYVPTANYAKKALGGSVFVDLKMYIPNPENAVELKDLMNKTIVSRFQTKLSSKENSDSIINIEVKNIDDTPLAIGGDVVTATYYRAIVSIIYTFDDKKGNKKSFNTSGYYDYSVDINSPINTYNNRYYAINQAFSQTLDQFIARIAYEGR